MSQEKYPELHAHIAYVFDAHQKLAKKPDNIFRGDNETPYVIHPVWCSTMIATEVALLRETRIEGTITLLYHDVLEDTNATLPEGLPQEIIESIYDMTFPGGMREEMIKIWEKPAKIRLFKLYDKVSNILDASWMEPGYLEVYKNYTRKLLADVEGNYGNLNIVILAHALTD